VRLPILITVGGWLAAEMALRIRQRGGAGRTVTREWRSLLVIWGAGALGSVLAAVLAKHTPILGLPLRGTGGTAAALAIMAIGIGLRLWSIAVLGRYFRPIVHIQQGHQVVRSGPYRILRHPAYTGLLLALFGLSFEFANIAAILVFNGGILAAVRYRIMVEERVLLDSLGDQYADHMHDTRRLVPGVW
jgi:protein-S-isoprenylcysteine O-methyltransferase Ste14